GEIANRLKRQVDPQTSSTDRLMPGAPIETEDEPTEASPPPQQGLAAVQADRLAAVFGRRGEDVAELVEGDPGLAAAIGETDLPLAAVPFVVANEWATSLEDVVERRLMLLYDRRFSRSALEQVADQLVQCGCLEMSCKGEVVEQLLQRWEEIYHFHVDESRPP
ncbi:MAG: glycerol-3-phosphate dehydrogenase C-terminal domain-containing protein, partial [Pirellulaceae bacterium]|nr:glycerol-3-phosphate dehydrogenase C-terminal domain-containing protein [Pirellulaceae bacterium]